MDGARLLPAEIDRLFAAMPGEEATRVLAFADALRAFADAADKNAAALAIRERFAPLGLKGLSVPSLYRKLADFRASGVWALVPAKWCREAARGTAANAAFVEHWQSLVLSNRRKIRPAWSRLLRDFRNGAEIPGVGTWRDRYLAERGFLPAEGEPCPWSERNPPPGWSLRSLRRLVPDGFAMLAASRGMAAAKAEFGLMVRKTRVGLPCCRVVEFDDMWYEHKVVFPGNREPQRVVEFAAMDRLTAHVICRLPKAIRERDDGTLETLRSSWARWLYHYVLCVSGIPAEGCVMRGERGTAKADATFLEALALVNAWREAKGLGAVAFEAGALANEPLAKGLHDGAAKGNPRHKGMIEQMHATLKNEMGAVLGEVGGGRGVQPEEAGAMVAEARSLMAIARARGLDVEAVSAPFLSWTRFVQAADEAHRRMDGRQVHGLEGWEECGFVAGEFRMKSEASWRSVPPASEMSPEEAGAIAALVKAGVAEYRERRLSPREAWEKSKGALRTVPEYFSPQILGPDLCAVARVNDHMEIAFADQNTGTRMAVAAVAGNRLLERGREYRVWVNPLDAGKAYVCDMRGTYIGAAKVLRAVRADATPEDLAAQLGMRRKVLAEEARRVAPVARRRLREANERAAANLAAFGLEDPVVAGALAAAAGPREPFSDEDDADGVASFLDGITAQ
ncbi:MAG: hypothetical protein IKH04_10780 [Kiritimatiellae bacterium]|nr:hypothetical protein [Kiritimatiellia bacterium]